MANPVSSVDVPLSLFSGWVTELSPPDIPEGASPQNNDVVYTPGAVATRSGLNRVFSIAIDSLGPISYEKSFVTPSGDIKNLYLTMQDGILWVEDVTNSPGTATQLFQSAGASYASSCTAQGREYIALSDGVHGADVPLIYDGTNLWRCSQDGPAVAPTVTSIALPTSTLQAASLGPFTVTSVVFNSPVTHGPITYYTGAAITLSSTVGIIVGTYISISGNTSTTVNDTVYVAQTTGGAGISVIQWSITPTSMTAATGTGGTAAVGASGNTLIRANNIVSGTTSTAHSLQPGYLAQITGGGTSQVGGGIVSIVLNNEDNPGIAVVTTTDPHGLLPQNQVNIQGVTGAVVGSAITNVAFAGDLVTITTSTPHKLSIGSEVLVAAVTNTTVNGQWTVVGVPTSTTFTYEFVSIVTAYSAADTGSVTYIWPLASTDPAENYFTVQTAPSPTTFTIQLSYTDGTWTGGTVSFGWDGQFFVLTTPSSTTFTYQQYGPNATTTAAATVTPYGQAAPGIHQCQVSYLFANDAISAPSPPATFVANGGQYLNVILPIGPSNVIGRIVQFTGAGGAFFFYIAVPAIVNGVLVSTATQINDNATINVLLDFSDNTLYGAGATPGAEGGAVSVPGNNLSAQLTLGPCAGFFTYASRVLAWGERNKIQNFLNLGFDADQSGINNPQGWTATGTADAGVTVSLTGRPPGCQWRMDCADSQVLSQSAYVDTFNAPILAPLTSYKIRLWLHASYVGSGGPNFIATFTSASTSYTSTATVLNSAMSTATQGAYIEAAFSLATPGTIPTDMLFNIANSVTGPAYSLQVDEIEIINIAEPYLDQLNSLIHQLNREVEKLKAEVAGMKKLPTKSKK